MADLIVVRGVEGRDGWWYNLDDLVNGAVESAPIGPTSEVSVYPTGHFEVRDDDGAVAEVWAPDGWEGP